MTCYLYCFSSRRGCQQSFIALYSSAQLQKVQPKKVCPKEIPDKPNWQMSTRWEKANTEILVVCHQEGDQAGHILTCVELTNSLALVNENYKSE